MDFAADRALQQIALRQARRRLFNERLAALDPEAGTARFRCECGLIACGMAIRLTAAEHAEVRSDPRQRALHPDHVLPEADRVLATHPSWVMIQTADSAGRHMNHDRARQQIVDAAAARVEEHR